MHVRRSNPRALVALALLVGLTSGCDGISGLDDPTLSFTLGGHQAGATGPDSIWVAVSRIHVAGTAITSGGAEPGASLDADGSSLVLSIDAGSPDDEGGSHTGIADWPYRAEIGPLDAGSYRLEIRQWTGQPRFLETLANTTLVIPP